MHNPLAGSRPKLSQWQRLSRADIMSFAQTAHTVQGPIHLIHPLLFSRHIIKGAGFEVEQQVLQSEPIWDASVTGAGLTH